jgi:hypothetical protein
MNMGGLWVSNWISTQEMSDMSIFVSNARSQLKKKVTRSHLKNRILAQGQGRTEFQPAGILKYVEDLKRGPNTEIGEKDFFEIASILNIKCNSDVNYFMGRYLWLKNISPKPENSR